MSAVHILVGVLLLLAASGQPRSSDAVGLEQDQKDYISDVDRFPGWKGTLPGIKSGEFSGDPNRVRTVASGSLGQARAPSVVHVSECHLFAPCWRSS